MPLNEALKIFKKYNFAAVLTGNEWGVYLQNYFAKHLGLLSNDVSALYISKDLMQLTLKNKKLNYIKFIKSKDPQEIIKWKRKNKISEIIIKPNSSGGTIDVKKCSSDFEIISYFNGKIRNEYIAEEFIPGFEFGVNFISYKGKHYFDHAFLYHKIMINDAPIHNTSTLLTNKFINSNLFKKVIDYCYKVLKCMHIKNGASHIEVKLDKNNNPVLIEIGARPMGSLYLSNEVFKKVIGHSYLNYYIESMIKNSDFKFKQKKITNSLVIKHMISNKEKEVNYLNSDVFMKTLSTYSNSFFTPTELSKKVFKTTDFFTRPGVINLSGNMLDCLKDYEKIRCVEKQFFDVLYSNKKGLESLLIHILNYLKPERPKIKNMEDIINFYEQIEEKY